jgi:hypothetical protein
MKRPVILSIIVAGSLVLSALIVAKPWVTIRQAKPIMVKGYAEQDVTADSGSLSAEVSATGPSNADAYTRAGSSLEKVKHLVQEVLGSRTETVELNTSVTEVMKRDENGNKTNDVDFYRTVRRIRISSADVQGLEKLGRRLFDLNAEGIHISVHGPDFFISNLDEIKLELIDRATGNGKERALLMAESSGETLGSLVSARQGVIQITKQNSTRTSSGGIYDTETIDKVVKLVVTLEYEIGR